MLAEYFRMGGPVMWLVFAAWVVVLATTLGRLAYWLGVAVRRPVRQLTRLCARGALVEAHALLERELERADHGTTRLDAFSQLATSLGLFGTVLGIASAFFGRGSGGEIAPEVLGESLATALFTTVAGLAVFLFGQLLLALHGELESILIRNARAALKQEATK